MAHLSSGSRKVRRLIGTALLAGALASCASTGNLSAKVAESTLASGWRVDCTGDQFKAQRTCFAGTFGDTRATLKFFQIGYVNGAGPGLFVPHDFPGRTPTVRVDNGPVLSDPAAIVEALKAGTTAYVVFHVWPTGEERMTVDVRGFSEAYALLLTKL